MPIRFIGDVHGKFSRYKTILNNSPHKTIQVGDMGVGFRNHVTGRFSANPPFDLMVEKDARFIRGNHDNPEVCRAHQRCIPDGQVRDNVMFIGGALSIDAAYRIEGCSWWRDEEISQDRLDGLVIEMGFAKPDIMITHECPERVAAMIIGNVRDLRGGWIKMDPCFASRTRVAFDEMHASHKPKLWIFGHWHVPFDVEVDGTRFICLPELAWIDVDTEKAEPIGKVAFPTGSRW